MFPDPVGQRNVRIIAVKPIQNVPDGFHRGNLALEAIINLNERFAKDRNIGKPALIGKGNRPPKLGIEGGQQRPQLRPQLLGAVCGVGIAFLIMAWQDFPIQQLVFFFQLI